MWNARFQCHHASTTHVPLFVTPIVYAPPHPLPRLVHTPLSAPLPVDTAPLPAPPASWSPHSRRSPPPVSRCAPQNPWVHLAPPTCAHTGGSWRCGTRIPALTTEISARRRYRLIATRPYAPAVDFAGGRRSSRSQAPTPRSAPLSPRVRSKTSAAHISSDPRSSEGTNVMVKCRGATGFNMAT